MLLQLCGSRKDQTYRDGYHFVQEKLLSKKISTEFVSSNDQLAYILTKPLRRQQIQFICPKLGPYNLYVPTSGEC